LHPYQRKLDKPEAYKSYAGRQLTPFI
jgi:hypothetical protein